MRAEGLEGLRQRIRNHVAWAEASARAVGAIPGVEVVTGPVLSLYSFALEDDAATEALLRRINDDGRIYVTQTRHQGRFVIRVSVGQFDCTGDDVAMIAKVVEELSGKV
jgi:aromatic-L-amino-acid decarboxylase